MSLDGLFAAEARNLGKSARTRARLMDAAVEVFGREGFAAASVNEIARLADVANGTFYVHFRDKDEIAAAVALGMAEEVARQLDEAMADIDDAVERACLATRRLIDLAASRPDWGLALARAATRFRDERRDVISHMRADLERGARQGAFTVPIDEFVVDMFGSMTLTALVSRLRGQAGPEAGSRVAELQLRMLGVDAARAREVAWRPLRPLTLTISPLPKGSAAPR